MRRDNSAVTVPLPNDKPIPELEKLLTLKWRKLVDAGRGQRVQKQVTSPLWRVTVLSDGRRAYLTYQGFWVDIRDLLQKLGWEVHVTYVGDSFPAPDLARAMINLMWYQKGWITTALMYGYGGLIGAPTRFGKSYGMTAICCAFWSLRTVITAPGIDLCKQIYDHLKDTLPPKRADKLRGIWAGGPSRAQGDDITVVSMDSLHKCDVDDTRLLLCDEPHAAVTDGRIEKIAAFTRARKYAFGATLTGRFDKRDRLLIGLFGPVLSNVSYRQAVEWGAICPLVVLMVKLEFSHDDVPGNPKRESVFKMLLGRSQRLAAVVKRILTDVVPPDWQTMMFIENEEQAEFFKTHAVPTGDAVIAMAKKIPKAKERAARTAAIAAGEFLRVLASKIYIQGLTFPDLRLLMNLGGGGTGTAAIQRPGRLLQKRPGKNYGVMVDFLLECKDDLDDPRANKPYAEIVRLGYARKKLYEEIGYEVRVVTKPSEMQEVIDKAYESHQPDESGTGV